MIRVPGFYRREDTHRKPGRFPRGANSACAADLDAGDVPDVDTTVDDSRRRAQRWHDPARRAAPNDGSIMQRLRLIALVVFPLIVGHILFPASLVLQVWRASHAAASEWLPMVCLATAYVALVCVSGAWSWFGRIPRLGLPLLLAAAIAARWTGADAGAPVAAADPGDLLLSIGLGSILSAACVMALLGRRAPPGALDLAFPLRGGAFMVGQGGASRVVNHHVRNASQRYALDLLMLNGAGVRARGLCPATLESYATWGADVVSPCDGVVAAAVDEFPDFPPPRRDLAHPAGNHVAIESGGATIYLAHLRRGSVAVRAGDRVRAGQPIGRVGNSGNTTEPHLHVHAEQGPYPGRFSGRPAVPITFGGRFLARNDRVVA